MTTIKIYRNRRNHNKFIEVHNDGHYHNTVRQFMSWKSKDRKVMNFTGDKYLHSWRAENLRVLLEDYEEVEV